MYNFIWIKYLLSLHDQSTMHGSDAMNLVKVGQTIFVVYRMQTVGEMPPTKRRITNHTRTTFPHSILPTMLSEIKMALSVGSQDGREAGQSHCQLHHVDETSKRRLNWVD